jgi:hypothetical protein
VAADAFDDAEVEVRKVETALDELEWMVDEAEDADDDQGNQADEDEAEDEAEDGDAE